MQGRQGLAASVPGPGPKAPRSATRPAGRRRPSALRSGGSAACRLLRGTLDASPAAPPSHERPSWLPVAWLAAPALLGSDLDSTAGRNQRVSCLLREKSAIVWPSVVYKVALALLSSQGRGSNLRCHDNKPGTAQTGTAIL